MKKLLLILFISVQLKNAAAQSWVYHPFPSDSAIWPNAHGPWDVHPTTPPTATLIVNPTTRYCMTSADTTIGSNTYSKVEYGGGAYRGALATLGILATMLAAGQFVSLATRHSSDAWTGLGSRWRGVHASPQGEGKT